MVIGRQLLTLAGTEIPACRKHGLRSVTANWENHMRLTARMVVASAAALLSISAHADSTVQALGDAFVAQLPAGWKVSTGSWAYFDVARCFTTPGYTCYGNNAATPYGSPYFGEYGANPNLATLQLDANEAVVVVFRTPPPMRYFSFGQYLYKEPGNTTEIFASMSDALNQLRIGTSALGTQATPPFDSYSAVVWTADQTTFETAHNALLAGGLPAEAINHLPLPQSIPTPPTEHPLQMGHGAGSAVFNMLMRTALPESPADYEAYRQESPFYVLRIGPTTPQAPNPVAVIGYSPEISGVKEGTALLTALNRLVSDIKRNYAASYTLTAQTVSFTTRLGWDCIVASEECTGENFDALYSRDVGSLVRVKSLQDFVIVAGVNHQKTGKASYVTHAVYDAKKLAAIVTATDVDFSSRSALHHAGITNPRDPRVNQYKNLYAYVFAYDCAGKSYCASIPAPTARNPVGLAPGAPFFVLGRSYLEPRTKVRPAVSEIVPHQAFVGSLK